MRGKAMSLVLGAVLLTMLAPGAAAAPVPDCPAIDAVDGHVLQCATTPGLMASTFEVAAGTDFSVTSAGTMDGTVRITNELGRTVYVFEFSTSGLQWVWAFGGDPGQTWTSTIELTSGFGAVVVDWEV